MTAKEMKRLGGPNSMDLRKVPLDQLRLMKPRKEVHTAFDEFKIDDSRFLEEAEGRSHCSKCGQSRKYFCYSCPLPLERFETRVPSVQLPFYVDILKHLREVSGKSTAVHAPIVAPEHVKLYTYPNIPDYRGTKERVVLISPGPGAVKLENLIPQREGGFDQRSRGSSPFDRAVLIDCTWNQVKKILNDPRVAGLQKVELSEHETLFWRYQTGKPSTYLATIEALFYFVLDVHKMTQHRPKLPNAAGSGAAGRSVMPPSLDLEAEAPIETMSSEDVAKSQEISAVTHTQVSFSGSLHNQSSFDLNSNEPAESGQTLATLAPRDDVAVTESRCDDGRACGVGPEEETVTEIDSREGTSASDESALPGQGLEFDVHKQLFIDECCHQYDNLLFYFKFMFDKIHNMYGSENLRAYKRIKQKE